MHRDIEITTAKTAETIFENSPSNEIIYPKNNQAELAWKDFIEGLIKWPIWLLMAYQDIKLRYRRSVLGPFWISISMGITVYSMGFLYAHLFHTDMQTYYPFLVAGMMAWTLISTVIIDLTEAYVIAENSIKQIKLPYTLYIHRVAARNIIIFFHNLIVIIPIYIIFHKTASLNFYFLLILPGLAIIYLNSIIFGIILAIIGSRYRDVSQIIRSLVQVVFFVTPVMWSPATLSEKAQQIISYNPFYSFLEMVRAPLLGKAPALLNYEIVLGITVVGFLVCSKLFINYRSRIIYWL